MKNWTGRTLDKKMLVVLVMLLGVLASPLRAQDRLRTMPGYDQYQKMSREIPGSVKLGSLSVTWIDKGQAFEYSKDGKTYRYDIAARKAEEAGDAKPGSERPERRSGRRGRTGGGPARGRQFSSAASPDGKLKAFYRDRNLWLSDAKGEHETPITTDGNDKARIKYGTASWVYGEELFQRDAMWWSPDSKKIAYYRFDESQVPDFFLQLSQTKQDGHRGLSQGGSAEPDR